MYIVRLTSWMNPNKEHHDLNPDHSRAAWNSILECILSDCNWVNQAQLKQSWSLYSEGANQAIGRKCLLLLAQVSQTTSPFGKLIAFLDTTSP